MNHTLFIKRTIFLTLVLVLVLTACIAKKPKEKVLTLEEAKVKAEKFVNDNLMQPGSKVTIKEASEEMGLYKITLTLPNDQEVVSYLTRNGEKFFPEAMDIAEVEAQKGNANQSGDNTNQPVAQVSNKKDKPEVELFVMSHCPYGAQIEKGILPAVEALGDKIDFQIKFCSYSMHGEQELDEQLKQYCIQKEEPTKFFSYLKCFLSDGDPSGNCLQSVGINSGKINSCVAATDKSFKVKEKYKDQNTWVSGRFPAFDVFKADNEKYGVQGSPTLIINAEQIAAGRDSASLLATICSAFNSQPEECAQQLSSSSPAPGFGSGTAPASSAGGCGN